LIDELRYSTYYPCNLPIRQKKQAKKKVPILKKTLQSTLTIAFTLLIAAGLSNCGSSSAGTTTATGSTRFAYLQVNGTTQTLDLAHAQAHALMTPVQLRAARHSQVHKAGANTADSNLNIESGSFDVYVADSANTSAAPVKLNTNYGSLAMENVQLSASGTKLVFTAADLQGVVQVWVADEKMATLTQLTNVQSGDCTNDYDATISADGSTVAFDQYNNGECGSPESYTLYTIPAVPAVAGVVGTPTAVATTGINDAWFPAFTPDGKTLVFTGCTEGCQTYSVGIGGGTPTQLTYGTEDMMPVVSPDGTTVAFTRIDGYMESGVVEIATVSIKGESPANPAKVLTSGLYSTKLSMLPQYVGSQLLFESEAFSSPTNGNGYIAIFAINPSGSSTTVTALTPLSATCMFSLDEVGP
jgi:hypothetical protein